MQPFISSGVTANALPSPLAPHIGLEHPSPWRPFMGLVLSCQGAPKGSEEAQLPVGQQGFEIAPFSLMGREEAENSRLLRHWKRQQGNTENRNRVARRERNRSAHALERYRSQDGGELCEFSEGNQRS